MKDPCSSILKLLEKYFDQEATDNERLLVEGHLRGCVECRNALKSMQELRTLMKSPVEEAVQKEDFPWVWQKIEREIRKGQGKLTWWQSLRSWLDVSPLFKKKVWIPAAATLVVLLLIIAQIIFKETLSYPNASVVEYLDSPTYNVMVYQVEPKVTVIWLFEGPEEGQTTT
jgi:predicted anti-sigma-YlaC factor YlaD